MFNPRVNGACLGETVRLRFTLSFLLSPIYDTPFLGTRLNLLFLLPILKNDHYPENARERSLARAPFPSSDIPVFPVCGPFQASKITKTRVIFECNSKLLINE